ncbi:MAG: ECF-type sigma factor, partial [Wenzhouxiangellaceae bacterium]|nr:ECF-type sigma factor [Wenzhouxiangellaceae bacterium]
MPAMPEMTRYLQDWQFDPGDTAAAEQLARLTYRQLRRIAQARLQREASRPFTPTELVHEAWLNLKPGGKILAGRDQFFKLASTVMRNLLVDHARERLAAKRGGRQQRVTLSLAENEQEFSDERLLDLDQALNRMAESHPRHVKVVTLRCFGGLQLDEVAAALDVSRATIKRDWTFACAWLADALEHKGSRNVD